MNFREKYINKYLDIIRDNEKLLTDKEKEFYRNIKRLHELKKVISSHQYNWLKDIAESIMSFTKK